VQQKARLLEVTKLLGQLRTSQRSNNRPIFIPEEGMSDQALWDVDWPALEAAEGAYEKALIDKYARFSVIDFALTKVQNKLRYVSIFPPILPSLRIPLLRVNS